MPLSEIQAEVLRAIAANRSPDSYLAGATIIHRRGQTPRYSQDIDLFHADAATNKLLALAGRSEIRDFVDILYLHDNFLSLGALAWAACGKDPGFTPEFLLDHAGRHVSYTQADLDRLELSSPLNLRELKIKWLRAEEEARALISALPASEIGCLYLDRDGAPVPPKPDSSEFSSLIRHSGCLRGAWPVVSDSIPISRTSK